MGDDWEGKFDELCGTIGIEVRYLKRTPAISTTQTIEVIQSEFADGSEGGPGRS